VKNPDNNHVRIDIRRLAEDVAASISDLLRLRSVGKESARMYRDSRLLQWFATESRAVVCDRIEPDPWNATELDALADRIRTAVVSDRSSVRQLSGRPVCVAPPEAGPRFGDSPVQVAGAPIPWVQLATAAGIGRELWDEDCDTWVSLPDDLPGGSYVALNVKGESMLPLLHDGDVVLVNMTAAARPGDIVLARTDDGYVVKRLARMSTSGVLLESLNSEFDPITIRDLPRPIAGVVVLRWCEHQTDSRRATGAA
jgi:SOS-response transcriptional repressor LexA